MESGKIVAWTKNVGDRVRRGETIAEVETEKAVVEMEAMTDGTLSEIVHQQGDEVSVGETIAYIEDD